MRLKHVLSSAAATALTGAALAVIPGSPALAAVNDDFSATVAGGCGTVNFIDYGEGKPGGGNNDDYFVIHDYCADGYGVEAIMSLFAPDPTSDRNSPSNRAYNHNGEAGAAVIVDPFGNVLGGDRLTLKVCLVQGTVEQACGTTVTHTSVDG
jgi:hypothetical protein